jgi:hypothetical protein
MPATVFNQGLQIQAQGAVNFAAMQSLVLLLWSGNVTPSPADNPSGTGGAYNETAFTGYSEIPMAPANWTYSGTAPYYATYPAAVFTSSAGSQNVYSYGYAVKQTSSGLWLLAERFVGALFPAHIVNVGDSVTVNFVLAFQSP